MSPSSRVKQRVDCGRAGEAELFDVETFASIGAMSADRVGAKHQTHRGHAVPTTGSGGSVTEWATTDAGASG